MTYLLIYFAMLAVVLPYSLMLVSVNRSNDGEVNENDTRTPIHKVNLLNGRLSRKRKGEKVIKHFSSNCHLVHLDNLS